MTIPEAVRRELEGFVDQEERLAAALEEAARRNGWTLGEVDDLQPEAPKVASDLIARVVTSAQCAGAANAHRGAAAWVRALLAQLGGP